MKNTSDKMKLNFRFSLLFLMILILPTASYSEESQQPQFQAEQAFFHYPVKVAGAETVFVRTAIPRLPATGEIPSTAERVVFLAPFNGQAPFIRQKMPEWALNLVTQHGFSVFTLAIDTGMDCTFGQNYYIFPEVGWHETVFAIHHQLCQKYGLTPRKLILVGESSGGSMVQQMVAAHPDKIECAAWCGGSIYAQWKPQTPYCPMFATNIWGCPGETRTRELALRAKDFHMDFTFCVTPPQWKGLEKPLAHHAPWKLQYDMMTEFICNPAECKKHYSEKLFPPADARNSIILPNAMPPHAAVIFKIRQSLSRTTLYDALWTACHLRFAVTVIEDQNTEQQSSTENEIKVLAERHAIPVYYVEQISDMQFQCRTDVCSKGRWHSLGLMLEFIDTRLSLTP